MLKKYFQDFFSYQLSHVLGGKKYTTWSEQTHSLQKNIPIQNKKLAKELEAACAKNGFLSYPELLTLEQFGENGYHATHKQHGMTDVVKRWPEALAALCEAKRIHHVVEFGPGDGKLGALTILEAKKLHHTLFWSGVEINEKLRKETRKLFKKKKLEKYLLQLVATLDEVKLKGPCLFVFSYSIDNLLPEVFINTSHEIHYPDAIVGITMKGSLLSEVLIKIGPWSHAIVQNGIYRDAEGYSWNLRQWQLHPMQRAYLPLHACRTLLKTIQIMPFGSQILIIDEFRESTHKQTYHMGLPRDLQTFSRDFTDFRRFYMTLGTNLLYFPTFLDSISSFLSRLGFSLEEKTGEHKLAYRLAGRNDPYPKTPRTFALLTSPKKKEVKQKSFILEAPLD